MNSISNLPLISIVIPNHNGAGYLELCLKSLKSQTYDRMEVIVVDNASADRSVEIVRESAPEAVLLRNNRNLGFAGGVNTGIRESHGDWIAVLNNDTEAAPDWLEECARAIANHPDAGFLACRIRTFSDPARLYSAGDCFLRAGIGYRRGQEQLDQANFSRECEIFAPSGCAGLYSRRALTETDGFDERFFAYLEDVDLGLRLQAAGYRGYYIPGAEVHHHGAGTSGGEFSSLAVRLRTRNALLLLLKSLPARILVRCLPMILLAQAFWFIRVLVHMRLYSYIQGAANALVLIPVMTRARAGIRPYWRKSARRLWQKILQSESLAREDFASGRAAQVSLFLKWYFRLF
jgi:GT2 family glycosyltransferase